MLSYNPNDYAAGDIRDEKFYKDLLSNLGLQVAAIGVQPFAVMGELVYGAGGGVYYTDISLGTGVAGVPTSRVLYHGNLTLTTAVPVFAGAGFAYVRMRLGGPELTIQYKTITAADTNYQASFFFSSAIFDFLACDPFGSDLRLSYQFSGLRIRY